jgi:ankyrin repeat protein
MVKKRKTLPKNISELLDKGNIDDLKSILSKSEINAYGGYNKHTIIGFDNCPDEITLWYIQQAGDINATDRFRQTALHNRASSRAENVNIKILIELGADINHNLPLNGTPLHFACDRCCINHIKTLLQAGADYNIKNKSGDTALEFALSRCSNIDIINMLEVSKIMLSAGVVINEKMQQYITEIGENFEFFRPNFDSDSVDIYSEALNQLYKLFDVKAVDKREMHDGISEITI